VKEIARLGGDVTPFVPAHVVAALARKFALVRDGAGSPALR
jgi:phosphopantetheine adenylyltransferase